MTPSQEESRAWMAGYKQANKDAREHWHAFVADMVADGVNQEIVSGWMIEVRNMHRTIKWLIEHMDEISSAWIRFPTEENRDVAVTTLDAVEQWLTDMGGVMGAEGFEEGAEEE